MIKQRNFWVFLLLNLITCGFYGIYFWYVWNKDVNCICEGDGHDMPNYIVVLLLGLVTCSIYFYYWVYKQGNRLQENADPGKRKLLFTVVTIEYYYLLFSTVLCILSNDTCSESDCTRL